MNYYLINTEKKLQPDSSSPFLSEFSRVPYRAATSRKWFPSGAVCATCRPSACRTGTRTLPAARPTNKFYHTLAVNDRLAHIEEEQRDEEKRKGVMVSLYNRRHDISTSKGTLSLLQQQPSFSLSLCLPSNALTTGSIHLRV